MFRSYVSRVVVSLFLVAGLGYAQQRIGGSGSRVGGTSATGDVLCRSSTGTVEACDTADFFWNSGLFVDALARFQNASDTTTCFQVLDANGGVPIVNVDCTNERFGIGTATPGTTLDVNGQIRAVPGDNVPACDTYTKTFTDLTTASATEDEVLFNLPANGKISGVYTKHSTAFSGGTLSALTVSVGDSSGTTVYTPTFDVFQATGNTVKQDVALFSSTTSAARDVLARFTAVGDTVDNITAGSVSFSVCWVKVP